MKGHKAIVLAAALLCIAAGVRPCPAQTTKPKASGPKWPTIYRITVKVPEILRKHLAKEFFELAMAVYPQADAKLIRQDAEKEFLREQCTFQVTRRSVLRYSYTKEGKSKVRFAFYLPLGRLLSVYTKAVPAGMKVKAPDKPLTPDQAKSVAEGAIRRIFPDPEQRKGMKLVRSRPSSGPIRDRPAHLFYFERAAQGRSEAVHVQVNVRTDDGVIRTVNLRRIRTVAPKVPFKEIAARAKKSIPEFNPKYLTHSAGMYFCKLVSLWTYVVPARPGGGGKYRTQWDAETGKLIWSVVLKGGTPRKPYRNPDFYFEPTEKGARSRLEKFLADAARKLQQAQKAGATRPASRPSSTAPALPHKTPASPTFTSLVDEFKSIRSIADVSMKERSRLLGDLAKSVPTAKAEEKGRLNAYVKNVLIVLDWLSSCDFGDRAKEDAVSQILVWDCLQRAGNLSLSTEQHLLRQLRPKLDAEGKETVGAGWSRVRNRQLGFGLHLWRRINDGIDPAWNPRWTRQPPGGIYPNVIGNSPEDIRDPKLRKEYDRYLEEVEEWKLQIGLRRVRDTCLRYLKRRIGRIYEMPPVTAEDLDMLKAYLRVYVSDEDVRKELFEIARAAAKPKQGKPINRKDRQ